MALAVKGRLAKRCANLCVDGGQRSSSFDPESSGRPDRGAWPQGTHAFGVERWSVEDGAEVAILERGVERVRQGARGAVPHDVSVEPRRGTLGILDMGGEQAGHVRPIGNVPGNDACPRDISLQKLRSV